MGSERFFNLRKAIDIHRRHLPHWWQPGVSVFVTWRLADALPETLLKPWHEQRDAWLATHPRPWSAEDEAEYTRRFGHEIEHWLDAGHGACRLRDTAAREVVMESLQAGEAAKRVRLHDYAIMPNHVHVLFTPLAGPGLAALVKAWKGVSARRINQLNGASGTLWAEEYWDRLIRDEEHLDRVRRYIAANPTRAKLREGEYTVWSQTRDGEKEDGHSCPSV